jgi:hypothetical protein
MSALLPKADMCGALADVCFRPIADIASFDHFVGDGEDSRRDGQAKRLGGLKVDDKLELGRQYDRKVSWLFPLRMRPV